MASVSKILKTIGISQASFDKKITKYHTWQFKPHR